MSIKPIELTTEEKALVAQIDFNPASSARHEPEYWKAVGVAADLLMKSLIARKAIPKVRNKFFTEPEFNIGGRGRSRAQVFEKNGTRADAIFRHPHFLKYLHYFLYGPDLPPVVIAEFQTNVSDVNSDIIPLRALARQLTRANRLKAAHAAEEFFKLALDCGLDLYDAESIRDSVRRTR